MIHRSHYVNKIRDLGYHFKSRQKRTELYRKQGETHRIFVPIKNDLEEDWVKSTLSQAGCGPDEIKAFIADAKA